MPAQLSLASSKRWKEDELPRNRRSCLCEIFSYCFVTRNSLCSLRPGNRYERCFHVLHSCEEATLTQLCLPYAYLYLTFTYTCDCIVVGECISRFTSRKVAYCIKFHPEEDKQDFFVAGTSDKKIVCVSDHHFFCFLNCIFCCTTYCADYQLYLNQLVNVYVVLSKGSL